MKKTMDWCGSWGGLMVSIPSLYHSWLMTPKMTSTVFSFKRHHINQSSYHILISHQQQRQKPGSNKFTATSSTMFHWGFRQHEALLSWHNRVDHISYMSMYNGTRYGTKYDLLRALCTFQQQVFSKVWAKQHPETVLDVEDSQLPWEGGQGPPSAWPFFPACPRCQEENQHHHQMSKTNKMPHEVVPTFWSHLKDPNSRDSSQGLLSML